MVYTTTIGKDLYGCFKSARIEQFDSFRRVFSQNISLYLLVPTKPTQGLASLIVLCVLCCSVCCCDADDQHHRRHTKQVIQPRVTVIEYAPKINVTSININRRSALPAPAVYIRPFLEEE